MIRLSLILATSGRESLFFAARSARLQMQDGDELLIVGGGAIAETIARWNQARWIDMPPGCNWGHKERNHAMPLACGTHLLFIDDDDALIPGALQVIRDAVATVPDRPHIFAMIDPHGRKLPMVPQIRQGNVGTPQIVAPNITGKLGVWGNRYEGDFDFIAGTVAHYADGPVWHNTVIYACRDFGRKAWQQ